MTRRATHAAMVRRLPGRCRWPGAEGYGWRCGRLVQVKPDGSVTVLDTVCQPLYDYSNSPRSPFNTRGKPLVSSGGQ